MSILDDAIREHLELKRAHGADEDELKRLENEAFGPGDRPDEPGPFEAEAPTEFLGAPDDVGGEAPSGRAAPQVADLQEPPPPPEEPSSEESFPATEHEAIPDGSADASETPAPPEPESPPQPAAEPEPAAAAEPAAEPGPSPDTEERRTIAEQPTQFFDVEAEIADSEESAPTDAPSPSDDQLVDAELAEPRLPSDQPLLDKDEDEDDFFSEQRLSEELDQALEEPLPGEEPPRSRADEPIPPGPHTEETEAHYAERDEDEDEGEDDDALVADYEPEDEEHDDVLEDTPDFLEDGDADDAWFEQHPPKDFDFDD